MKPVNSANRTKLAFPLVYTDRTFSSCGVDSRCVILRIVSIGPNISNALNSLTSAWTPKKRLRRRWQLLVACEVDRANYDEFPSLCSNLWKCIRMFFAEGLYPGSTEENYLKREHEV